MRIYPITKNWDPAGATWDNLSQSCGVAVVTKELPSGTLGDITFDVTSLISDIVDGSTSDYGFMLSCTTSYTGSSNGQFSYFASSEYVTEDKRPMLSIEYNGTNTSISNSKYMKPLTVDINGGAIALYSSSAYKGCSIAFYSLEGRLIYVNRREIEVGHNNVVLPESLASGCYICKVTGQNLLVTEKVLIE